MQPPTFPRRLRNLATPVPAPNARLLSCEQGSPKLHACNLRLFLAGYAPVPVPDTRLLSKPWDCSFPESEITRMQPPTFPRRLRNLATPVPAPNARLLSQTVRAGTALFRSPKLHACNLRLFLAGYATLRLQFQRQTLAPEPNRASSDCSFPESEITRMQPPPFSRRLRNLAIPVPTPDACLLSERSFHAPLHAQHQARHTSEDADNA